MNLCFSHHLVIRSRCLRQSFDLYHPTLFRCFLYFPWFSVRLQLVQQSKTQVNLLKKLAFISTVLVLVEIAQFLPDSSILFRMLFQSQIVRSRLMMAITSKNKELIIKISFDGCSVHKCRVKSKRNLFKTNA